MTRDTDRSEALLDRQNGQRTLVVMAKAPRAGMVKTRLASALPVTAVTELYGCLLADTLDLAHSLPDVKVAIMCPAEDVDGFAQFRDDATEIVPQQGTGLAAGLRSVFAHFASSRGKHVIAFNSDSPHLPSPVLTSAFDTLTARDLVVGPTHDGGYYLVGAKAPHDGLFDGDGLGTHTALDALLGRASRLQLSVGLTDPFYDIDVAGDLSRLAFELRNAPGRAPRTAAWLAQWQRDEPLLQRADEEV